MFSCKTLCFNQCYFKIIAVTPCSGISFQMDGYMLSYFIAEMKRSSSFRTSFLRCWTKQNNRVQLEGYSLLVLVAHMKEPENEVLDLLGYVNSTQLKVILKTHLVLFSIKTMTFSLNIEIKW